MKWAKILTQLADPKPKTMPDSRDFASTPCTVARVVLRTPTVPR
jgi:hypothetical protein